MSGAQLIAVATADAGTRLDRWLRGRFPGVRQSDVQKWLRTGQVRVDGRRAKAGLRLEAGMAVRVPPQAREATPSKGVKIPPALGASRAEAEALRARVLYRDDDMIAIDKPAGLAVQGGTGTRHHLDAMLDALRFGGAERPRLVHRLDRDTSGVLVLARHRAAAQALTAAFRGRGIRKLYLAVTVGCPRPRRGRIDLALGKAGGRERMVPGAEDARGAATLYAVLGAAGSRAAVVALQPLTGRTHQLRAHLAAIGTPILGDGKYGGRDAFIAGAGLEKRLHLHARALTLPKPAGGMLAVAAPLPPHLEAAFAALGLDLPAAEDPFPRD
jgi:23S rRNA pseudouridine955/2504/2580 synthase